LLFFGQKKPSALPLFNAGREKTERVKERARERERERERARESKGHLEERPWPGKSGGALSM
jgi:hypothetical protein